MLKEERARNTLPGCGKPGNPHNPSELTEYPMLRPNDVHIEQVAKEKKNDRIQQYQTRMIVNITAFLLLAGQSLLSSSMSLLYVCKCSVTVTGIYH